MKFMNVVSKFGSKKEYSDYRKKMLDEAEKLLKEGKVDEANSKMKDTEELDTDYEDYCKAQANMRAMSDNPYAGANTDLIRTAFTGGILTSDGIVNSGSAMLNKNDSLFNRVCMMNQSENACLMQDGALGEVVRGMVTGSWSSPSLKNAVTTTATGTLIPSVLSSKIIDKARDISLFTVAGVPILPMESNNVTVSRVKTDPTFAFKEEGQAATESSFELDSVELKSKTCYGYAYVSLEAINSSKNLDSILYSVFAKAMAQAIDKGMLYGQYNSTSSDYETFAPGGIMNDSDINSQVYAADDGYDAFIKAIGKVKANNGKASVMGITSNTEQLLSLLKTSDGQYLEAPKAIKELTQIVSNQLTTDTTNGDDALVFDPESMLIGMQNNIQIKIIEDSECLKKGLVAFQIYSMLDCKAVTPKNICKITSIK